MANWFTDWADADQPDDNYTRYEALAMNGASLYYQTSKQVREQLADQPYTKPVLITMSEDDSVIEAKRILELFNSRFTHNNSRMVWYGNPLESSNKRLIIYKQRIPEERISNFSHMSVLFASDNPFYGKSGEHRICDNGQKVHREKQCLANKEVWYSAWGYQEKGKAHARLTWNPYYQELTRIMAEITRSP